MTPIQRLQPVFVDAVPSTLLAGQLYISKRYRTAVHLCCCGCGLEVVTPLNPAKWRLTEQGNTISLYPSIGNWSFPCRSHYWIERNQVRWSRAMSKVQIDRVRERDQRAVELYAQRETPPAPSATAPPPLAPPTSPQYESPPSWWQRLLYRILGM